MDAPPALWFLVLQFLRDKLRCTAFNLLEDQRKAAGLTLALVGGLTTIPLAMEVIGRKDISVADINPAA